MKDLKQLQEHYGCSLPFINQYVVKDPKGYSVKPCCMSTVTPPEYVDTYKELKNHKIIEETQNAFLEKRWPSTCTICKLDESAGERSYRQSMWYRHINHFETKKLVWDLRFDNVCNLKCIMCNPSNSSKWNEDLDIYNQFNDTNIVEHFTRKTSDIDDILNECRNTAIEINLLGGEPFYSKNTFDFIERLSANVWNTENTELIFVSNGNGLNNKWIELLKRFRKISIMLSLDGVGELANYIRYPTDWDQYLKNVDIIKENNWNLAFNITWSALNLYQHNEIIEFCKQNHIRRRNNILHNPNYLGFNALKNLKPIGVKNIDYYIENHHEYDDTLNKKLKNYLETLDAKRNLNSKNLMPWCWE
jgi:organic radical activating enzyme